jgi:hypothetical protein
METSLDPNYDDCWQMISYSTTGTATMTINSVNGAYNTCNDCVNKTGAQCHNYYLVSDCCRTQSNQVVYLPQFIHDNDYSITDSTGNCWRTISPTVGPATITWLGGYYVECGQCTTWNPCPG